jgi:hypothetical protein
MVDPMISGGHVRRITPPIQPPGTATPLGNWDAAKMKAPRELLQAGFELAYFILPDRSTAIDILVRALGKVRVRSRREVRRLYWRDKHADSPVRRMARSDGDMLQWLIMFESEREERVQERTCTASLEGMVIRYIKHLIQITTALSSFYVSVGLTRLLHSYTTSETQRAYEMLTNRYLGADEYRRAKAALMDKIAERFEGFLRTTRVEHGELRFEALYDQKPWLELVNACLKSFAPWSTQRISLELATTYGDNRQIVTTRADVDRNDIELRSCHLLIEPQCFSQLMKVLALDPPATKLALPRFVMNGKEEKSADDGHGRPLELSNEEIAKIQRHLAATDMRRHNLNERFVTILLDDAEFARLDLTETKQCQIDLEAGANLLEVRGQDDRGELVLATHFISYANDAFEFSIGSAILNKGKLKLRVDPITTSSQEPSRAKLSLKYYPTSFVRRFSTACHEFMNSGARRRSYALATLTIAVVVCAAAAAFYAHKIKVLEQQLQQAHRSPQQLSPTAARAIVSYALIPDRQRVRGNAPADIPEISLRLHSSAVALQLPLSQVVASASYRAELKTFSGDRTLMIQSFLRPALTDAGWTVEIVLPVDLLKPDTYYTVHLYSTDSADDFTFKVTDQ